MPFFSSRVSQNALGLFGLEDFLRALRVLSGPLSSRASRYLDHETKQNNSIIFFPQSAQRPQRTILHSLKSVY